MKRKIVITAEITILSFLLVGCTSLKERIEQKMLAQSGIENYEQYQEYKEYVQAGHIDSEGYYSNEEEKNDSHDGQVHVTFSENSNLSADYYYDEGRTQPIDIHNCYINPGDTIWGNVEVKRSVANNVYKFTGFEVFEYEDGNKYLNTDLVGDYSLNSQVLVLPADYGYTDISIIPVGEYEEVVVTLNDYYLDDETDEKHPLNGVWSLNNIQCTDDSISISSISPYIISYEYDNNEFFYLNSSLDTYYIDNDQGLVVFKQRQPYDDYTDYYVALHKYLTISIRVDSDRTINVNGNGTENFRTNDTLTISGLMYGSKVSIITNKEWPELENLRDMIISAPPDPFAQGGWEYRFVVPQKGGEFLFDPKDYSYDHGKIRFKCFGEEVTSPIYLAPGTRIYYEQVSADSNYWLLSGENYIVVSDEDTTRQQLEGIQFTEKLSVEVKLPQPVSGGSIIYRGEDGSQIYTNTYDTYSGTVITMEFKPWEGWINQFTNGEKYLVDEGEYQTITIDGKPVETAFTEDEGHKPNLTITLEKSVGENMGFSFEASGLGKDDYTYESGWFRSDYKIVDQKIGTDKPILVTMGNRAIPSGQAVRVVIEKKDTSGNTYSETRYYDSLTNDIPPIYIYSTYEAATSLIWYKSINIKIGVVDIEKFTLPTSLNNATITVYKVDENIRLYSGDLIEPDEKVLVVITPSNGYYVTGKNVTNDIYKDTMKYSEYLKKIDSIINDHPIFKLITVTLDTSDSFATYVYTIDKNIVSGTISVHEGTKITLKYTINDSEHDLTESSGGFFGWGGTTKETEETITINASMDNSKITRSTFGIYVFGE